MKANNKLWWKIKLGIMYISCVFTGNCVFAQVDSTMNYKAKDTLPPTQKSNAGATQRDALDILMKILGKDNTKRTPLVPGKISFIVLPSIYYSVATGFAGTISASLLSYASDDKDQNLSSVSVSASLTQKHQKTLSAYSTIWTKHNKYSFQGAAWDYNYTENTYGLGSKTPNSKKNLLSYQFIRFYESVLKSVYKDVYLGLGYRLDYHYNIRESGNEDNTISDYRNYSSGNRSVSSGPSFDFLFDNRRNPFNPGKSSYISVEYNPKLKALGSDNNWQMLQLDLRKYITPGAHSNNILAFWSLLWFTMGDRPPYLDLPGTNWDVLQRTQRGYTQGRYRGANMLYLEGEYRFGITHDGLLGAAVFANAASFSEQTTNRFERILPAAGAGLRIKLSKFNRTNLCLDYAFGVNGSGGLFVNLGEWF